MDFRRCTLHRTHWSSETARRQTSRELSKIMSTYVRNSFQDDQMQESKLNNLRVCLDGLIEEGIWRGDVFNRSVQFLLHEPRCSGLYHVLFCNLDNTRRSPKGPNFADHTSTIWLSCETTQSKFSVARSCNVAKRTILREFWRGCLLHVL